MFDLKWPVAVLLSSALSAHAAAGLTDVVSVSSMWQTFLSLVVVVALIPLLLLGVKKVQSWQLGGKSPELNIVKVHPLGGKERLMIVEVEGERLLLGVTAHSVSLLKNLTDPQKTFVQWVEEREEKDSDQRATE